MLNKLTPLTSLNVTEISSELTSTWFVSCILNIVPVNSTKNKWICKKSDYSTTSSRVNKMLYIIKIVLFIWFWQRFVLITLLSSQYISNK